MEELSEKFPQLLRKVNDGWIEMIHSSSSDHYSSGKLNFKDIDQVLIDSENFDFQHEILKDEIIELVKGNNKYYPVNDRRKLFPGPLAATLSRKHTKFVRENKYYITEKSDGYRAMFYARFNPRFPRWQFCMNENACHEFSVSENAILECIFMRLKRKNSLNRHKFEFFSDLHNPNSLVCGEIQKMKKHNPNSPGIRLYIPPSGTNKKHQHFELKKQYGLWVCYLFDRKFQFYLVEESTFVFPSSSFVQLHRTNPKKLIPMTIQQVILLDGELVPCFMKKEGGKLVPCLNMKNKPLNYSVFDIICCGEKLECVNNFDLDKKLLKIKSVVNPHHYYYNVYRLPPPRTFSLVCKHFYEKNEVQTVLSYIQKREGIGYVYKGYNKNDGLVFTPIDVRYYHFVPGPCYKLLKWKWSDKNTCDFRISLGPNERIDLYYGCSKKSSEVSFFKGLNSMKGFTTELRERLRKKKEGFLIAELFFDVNLMEWMISCVRDDKAFPNTFLSITSILMCQIENISKEELVDLVLGTDRKANINEKFSEVVCKQDNFIHVGLGFARGDRKRPFLIVRYREFTFTTTFTYVEDCVCDSFTIFGGSEEEDEFELEGHDLVRAISDKYFDTIVGKKERITVKVLFLPSSGTWKIVSFRGDEKYSFGDVIMKRLEKMTCDSNELRKSALKRKREKVENPEEEEEVHNQNSFVSHGYNMNTVNGTNTYFSKKRKIE